MRAEKITSYSEALGIVLEDDSALARRYAEETSGARQYAEEGGQRSAGEEVDKKAKALLADKKVKTYAEALDRVLEADTGLAERYAHEA